MKSHSESTGQGCLCPRLDVLVYVEKIVRSYFVLTLHALEPNGPTNLQQNVTAEWSALDSHIIDAYRRRLNVIMQAPVMDGNAGGPRHGREGVRAENQLP